MSSATLYESQHVTDYPNNNTIFTVWKFKENMEIKPAFEQLCVRRIPAASSLPHR